MCQGVMPAQAPLRSRGCEISDIFSQWKPPAMCTNVLAIRRVERSLWAARHPFGYADCAAAAPLLIVRSIHWSAGGRSGMITLKRLEIERHIAHLFRGQAGGHGPHQMSVSRTTAEVLLE